MAGYLKQFDTAPQAQRWPLVRGWIFGEPLPFFDELRRDRPILVTPEVTIATRFADCTEILRRHQTFSVALYRPKQGDYWMDEDDTAPHWRDKSIMQFILDFEDIPAIRQYVADKAASLLAAAGGSIDAVSGLTRAVPIALVQDWFGFSHSDPALLCKWSYWNQIDTFWNQPFDKIAWPDPAKIVAARQLANVEMVAYLVKLVAILDQHCAQCHGISQSPDLLKAWATPIKAVGTDPKMAENAARMSDPGMYAGSLLPPPAIAARFSNPANTSDILAASVVGILTEEAFTPRITPEKVEGSGVWRALRKDLADLLPNERLDDLIKPNPILLGNIQALARTRLNNMFKKPGTADAGAAYESRVLRGIWATAPYLHNGSVASLWELLKPAKERPKDFMVGSPVFDPKNVGYATTQSPFALGKFVTDPDNANGNGNGGHEYGTQLSEDARWAIVEYLKSL